VKSNSTKFKTQLFTLSRYHYEQAILELKMVSYSQISSCVMKEQNRVELNFIAEAAH
jgi:hypothetical protein